MQTRGSTVNTETGAVSTPPAETAEGKRSTSTRLRSTRTKSKAIAVSSEEEGAEPQSMTPTRRSTRTAARKATELIHDVTDILSPRKRTAAKKAEEQSSADDEVVVMSPRKVSRGATTPRSTRGARKIDDPEGDARAPGSPTPRRRTTRRTASADSLASATSAEDEGIVEEVKKTLARRGRPPKASKNSVDDSTDSMLDLLPPPHPDVDNAARALASLAGGTRRQATILAQQQHQQSQSSGQSVDEGFKTPPESPQVAAVGATESSKDEEYSSSKEGEDETFEDAVDEISDLSDIGDPHFTEIMSSKAATAAISAAGSMAGSVTGDSDVESDDDEAPEMVTSKAPRDKQPNAKEASDNQDAVVPKSTAGNDGKPEQSARAKKRRRARHRKRAVVMEARKSVSAAMSDLSKRHALMASTLPSDIPEELRLELHEKLVVDPEKLPAKRSTAAVAAGDKLDTSVLEQFAQQSKNKRSKADAETLLSAERKRARKEKKKKNKKDRASRVVSGINVVASRSASKTNLLQTLAQSVPDSVRRFAEEKHGGNRVKRSDPLVAIARSNNQAAISFFK
ncbi:hypothetical protein IW138_001169 [Coemansia sp. RSA 986]|nr:hypothetical protein IW138_001169 [Coemansia sp. RSA 986]